MVELAGSKFTVSVANSLSTQGSAGNGKGPEHDKGFTSLATPHTVVSLSVVKDCTCH